MRLKYFQIYFRYRFGSLVLLWYVYGTNHNIMAETQDKTHKTRSIRIPKDVDKQLQKRAKSQGRSINSQIIYELKG